MLFFAEFEIQTHRLLSRPVSSCLLPLAAAPSRSHIRMLFHFFTYSRRSTAQISKVGDGGRRLISKRVHSSPFRNFTLTASTVSKFAFGSLSNGCRNHPRHTRLRLVRVLNFKNNKISGDNVAKIENLTSKIC